MPNLTKFTPSEFESKLQKIWEEKGVYQPDLLKAKKPFFNLMMFPYPSAEGLHVGNVYAFTGADIYGRFMRMKGNSVFEPIGLDGFGIHSENYAIKIGKHPKVQAEISQKNFYRQLHSIGNGFAWKNTLETYDPDYYRWTQWLFVQMFKKGLAYRKKAAINFCPSCKTGLSDEQVIDGTCERCKSLIEKREMEQWFFKITDYAERLLQNTYKPTFQWSNKVKIGQRNWIGKKEGINITYPIVAGPGVILNEARYSTVPGEVKNPVGNSKYGGDPSTPPRLNRSFARDDKAVGFVTCFTTRPDTNFGATFVVLAPEHPFVASLLKSKIKNQKSKMEEIKNYTEKAKKKSEIERITEGRKKTGIFTGYYCINQLTNCKMPIYVSDFVLGHVGTGAVVGVPGHDKRDFEFAQEFNLPVIRVVTDRDGDTSPITHIDQAQEEEGIMVNSGFLDGMDIHKATTAIMDYIEEKGWGERVTTHKLRDWCISRQRYWGAPIPMIYCYKCASEGKSWFTAEEAQDIAKKSKIQTNPKSKQIQNPNAQNSKSLGFGAWNLEFPAQMAGWYPVSEEELPVLLPYLEDWKPEGTGKGPLAKVKTFVEVKCPNCEELAERETDVCDTFLDSSWYFLRYPSVEGERIENRRWKVGVEGRKLKRDKENLSSTLNLQPLSSTIDPLSFQSLPFDPKTTKKWLPVNMYIGGAEHTVLHLLYARFATMALHDMGYLHFEEPFSRFYAHGLIIAEGTKMSKSKGNIIVPDEYIRKYGADTLRTYLMFLGPFDQGGDFRDAGIAGMYRFLGRVWRLVNEVLSPKSLKLPKSLKPQDTSGVAAPSEGEEHDSPEVERSEKLLRIMHKTIKEVTEDLENLRYNTAIAHIMTYVNEISNIKYQISNMPKEIFETLLLLLAPFAPHMTEELWQKLNQEPCLAGRQAQTKNQEQDRKVLSSKSSVQSWTSVHLHPWPTYDPKYLQEEEITIVVQVNGKLRDTIKIPFDKAQGKQSEVEEEAGKSEKVQKYLTGKKIRKIIFVPGRLVNFVTLS